MAVWDCGGDRASSPDGFTFKFFPKGYNSSFIALIPKVSNSTLVADFRPISLIGCQYKIIGNILANRLGMVIGSCISPEQSAFIKGRNILDGPLIINEVVNWYRKRKEKLMIFKVDFEKAFDSFRWDFLDIVMDKLGFGSRWRSWIKGCFLNAQSSILVNGSSTSKFDISKGLRQGDPLSPFLFILAMEGLHAFICKDENIGIYNGASVGKDNMHISHLIYADDVIFMGHCLFGVCVLEEDILDMANIIGCEAAKLPMKYLGVPRFLHNHLDLWIKVIKGIYGHNGGIFDEHLHRSSQSPWSDIPSLVKSIKQKGIDLLFPRIYMLYNDKGCSVANRLPMLDWSSFLRRIPRGGVEDAQLSELRLIIDLVFLTSQKDSWLWSLDVSKGFMVASVRSLIDSHILECGPIATR
nr:RNA-directed DNA polymerase, eukaryota, reverse transcriptase zinc-binding domain protein [Tanacetum cinerariifolium]